MANPTPYARSYSFKNWQSQHPSEPLPGDQVDAELDNVATSLGQTITNLDLIQRSDGKLQNGIVGVDALDPVLAVAISNETALAGAAAAAAASATAAAGSATTATTQAGIATAAASALTGNTNNRRIVRAAAIGNVTISNPGTATFDGVVLSNGDRILLPSQTAAAEKGVYDFNGSGVAMTRSADSDTSVEMPPQLVVAVSEGSANAGANYTLTTAAPITLGTTSLTFRKDQNVATSATPQFAGVKFGSGGTLTDYEEGTWTPVDGFSAYTWSAVGYYVKVGSLVHIWALVNTGTMASGVDMQVAGLPYAIGGNGSLNLPINTNWIAQHGTSVIKPAGGGAFSTYQNSQLLIVGSYTTQA